MATQKDISTNARFSLPVNGKVAGLSHALTGLGPGQLLGIVSQSIYT